MCDILKNPTLIWDDLLRKYSRNNKPLDFNFRLFTKEAIPSVYKKKYTHFIHRYPGKVLRFIPSFIFRFSDLCQEDSVILDPFCGSGTILLESLLCDNGFGKTFGVEINPLGRLISKVKTTPIETNYFEEELKKSLVIINKNSKEINKPDYSALGFWFSEQAIKKLGLLKAKLDLLPSTDVTDFFWLTFSNIIREVSLADPLVPPPVKINPTKYEANSLKQKNSLDLLQRNQNPPVIQLFAQKIEKNKTIVKSLNEKIEHKHVPEVIWNDARNIRIGRLNGKGRLSEKSRQLRNYSVDLILTSPPYLSAQKYIRSQKLELLWLGLLDENEVRRMEREIIGTEHILKKDIAKIEKTKSPSVNNLINWAMKKSPVVACKAYKYFKNMEIIIDEFFRILKSGGHLVFILGNNSLLHESISTYEYIIEVAEFFDFELKLVLKDKIRGRGMFTKRHNSGGLITEEYVVVLQKK